MTRGVTELTLNVDVPFERLLGMHNDSHCIWHAIDGRQRRDSVIDGHGKRQICLIYKKNNESQGKK